MDQIQTGGPRGPSPSANIGTCPVRIVCAYVVEDDWVVSTAFTSLGFVAVGVSDLAGARIRKICNGTRKDWDPEKNPPLPAIYREGSERKVTHKGGALVGSQSWHIPIKLSLSWTPLCLPLCRDDLLLVTIYHDALTKASRWDGEVKTAI